MRARSSKIGRWIGLIDLRVVQTNGSIFSPGVLNIEATYADGTTNESYKSGGEFLGAYLLDAFPPSGSRLECELKRKEYLLAILLCLLSPECTADFRDES